MSWKRSKISNMKQIFSGTEKQDTFVPVSLLWWKMLYIFLYVICQPKLWTWSSDSPHQTQSKQGYFFPKFLFKISFNMKPNTEQARIFFCPKKEWIENSEIRHFEFVESIGQVDKCKIWKTYIWGKTYIWDTNNQWKLFSQCCSNPYPTIHLRWNLIPITIFITTTISP